jgi:hypothetical protein
MLALPALQKDFGACNFMFACVDVVACLPIQYVIYRHPLESGRACYVYVVWKVPPACWNIWAPPATCLTQLVIDLLHWAF